MSHQPERKEKDCLNCGTQIHGRFCHVCGQENVVTHQKFWSLARHFIFDVLHFDGKFFHTLLYIFTRPGFVARQYVEGKRISYLDPIRMYLFTSALFFLIFFTAKPFEFRTGDLSVRLNTEDRKELIEEYKENLKANPADTVYRRRIAMLQDTTIPINIDSLGWGVKPLKFGKNAYTSLKQYDSAQAAMPDSARDNWLVKNIYRRGFKANEKYGRSDKLAEVYIETFLHKLPSLLFVSLPFFALILKLLYSRRKVFYYSDHAVFTLYHYIFSFILLLLIFSVAGLRNLTEWGVFRFIIILLLLSWPAYLYLELKRFYNQGWLKTFVKFLLLNLAGMFIVFILFVIFLLISVFQL